MKFQSKKTSAPNRLCVRLLKYLIGFLLISGPTLSAADYALTLQTSQEAQLESQRKAYHRALKYLGKGQRSRFRDAIEALEDYPLYPYLKYKEYSRYISSVSKEELEDFLSVYGDTPMATWLKRRWIQSLADQKQWETYLNEYRLGEYNTEYDCYYYWAQYKTGERESAFAGARLMWLVGKSQHNACDPLFQVWKTTGEMQGDLAWERTAMAMDNRQLQLAQYLEQNLDENKKPLSREWRRLYRDSKRLKQISRYQKWGDDAKPMIITGMDRLIRKDNALAQKLWPEYLQTFQFTAAEKAKVANEFALVLTIRRQARAEYWLNQAAQYGFDPELIPLGIRHALYSQDWHRLQVWLAMMDDSAVTDNGWQYWKARSELKLGSVDLNSFPRIEIDKNRVDVQAFQDRFLEALYSKQDFLQLLPRSVVQKKFVDYQPINRLKKLSSERDYYGFLASERLHKPLNLNNVETPVSEENLNKMLDHPGVQRVRELHIMKLDYVARAEWEYLIRQFNEQDRSTLAHLAYIWGWHNPAIRAAYRSESYNNLEIRFPIAYQPQVNKYAEKAGLDTTWVYSLIRQESAFMPAARSAVGAMGMMQIMPGTAKQISNSIGISTPSTREMLTAESNIHLGTVYMSQLLKEFKGNLILATAAYNAGPHRARAWQPKYIPVSGDIWVETIPFHETRGYVKNILTYQAIYRHHLGEQVRLSSALHLIPPKKGQATAQLY
ncbi:MAG: hypothetical protein D6160_14525 [Ketobacter sp.]|nr:MAG: hypothetical protein D6160_14525 [Ketobacter sp.]